MWSALLSSKKCMLTTGNEKTWPFYTDPGQKRFWIHDKAGVIFCYCNNFFVKTVHNATQRKVWYL